MSFCKKCSSYLMTESPCWCQKFEVINEKYSGEDITEIWARGDEETAASKYAEENHADQDYPEEFNLIVNGKKIHVQASQETVFSTRKITK